MLNPISNAVREIQMTIPAQILTEVFGREDYRNWRRAAPVSVDEMIKSKVIRPRVLKDCNLIGGREAIISLEGLSPSVVDDSYAAIYNVPLERTGNRELMSVLSVNYIPSGSAFGGGPGMAYASSNPIAISDVQSVGQRVMDSVSNIPHICSAQAELIGYNTVIIRDSMRATHPYELRCIVANDENLSNISPRSYPNFARACALAVKSYIYNQLIIRINQGVLEQGQELGVFKQIVEEYRESEEQYQDYLKLVLRKVFFMNDMTSHDRYISIQINPGL